MANGTQSVDFSQGLTDEQMAQLESGGQPDFSQGLTDEQMAQLEAPQPNLLQRAAGVFTTPAPARIEVPTAESPWYQKLGYNLSRPGAGIRNMLLNDPAKLDTNFAEGFMHPEVAGDMTNFFPGPSPDAPAWVKEAGTWAQAGAGAIANLGTDPTMYVGIPGAGVAGKALGQGMVRAAQYGPNLVKHYAPQIAQAPGVVQRGARAVGQGLGQASQFVGNQLRGFSPRLAAQTNPSAVSAFRAGQARVAPVNTSSIGPDAIDIPEPAEWGGPQRVEAAVPARSQYSPYGPDDIDIPEMTDIPDVPRPTDLAVNPGYALDENGQMVLMEGQGGKPSRSPFRVPKQGQGTALGFTAEPDGQQMQFGFGDRPPVQGAGGQMELNFGQGLEGRPGETPFPFPEKQPGAPGPARTSPKWERQERKRRFLDEKPGEQMDLDFDPRTPNVPMNVAQPPRTPRASVPDQGEFPFMQEQAPLRMPNFPPDPTVADRMRADFGEFFAPFNPAKEYRQPKFDFTKQASWAAEPKAAEAKPLVASPARPKKVRAPKVKQLPEGAVAPLPKGTVRALNSELDPEKLRSELGSVLSPAEREVNDITVAGQKKALAAPEFYENVPEVKKAVDAIEREMNLADRAGDSEKVNKLTAALDKLIDEDSNVRPTWIDDIKTVLKGIEVKSSGRGGRRLGNKGTADIDVDLSPEAREALKRLATEHADALAEHMAQPGATVASYVAKNFGDILPEKSNQRALTRYLQRERTKIGNLYTDVMPPKLAGAVRENPEIARRPKTSDEEVLQLAGSSDAEKALQTYEHMDPKAHAAAIRHGENMAYTALKAAEGDSEIAKEQMMKALEYMRLVSRARYLKGLGLRHSGQHPEMEGFKDLLQAAYDRGDFIGADEQLVKETLEKMKQIAPSLMRQINNGIQTYGINMMLYNTDTSMRNVIGGAIGTIMNPLERVGNAFTTAGARGVNKLRGKPLDYKIDKPTEFGEIIPSLKAGAKSIIPALRTGAKSFLYEDAEGLANKYAREGIKIRKQRDAGQITSAQMRAKIEELQKKKLASQKEFDLGSEESLLNMPTSRPLKFKVKQKDNAFVKGAKNVGNAAGYGVTAATRGLKSVDLVNSHIIKNMETAAAEARKVIQARRAGGGIVTLSAADKRQIYENVLHYTLRQRLPKGAGGLSKVINSNAVTGLLFPFMRAQIALPRFAVNRSPLALGSIGRNAVMTVAGKEKLDLMQITRAAMGTAMAYTAWKAINDKGVEVHGAARTPEERQARKALKLPPGVYLKFRDGSTKRVDDIAPVSYYFAAAAAIDDMKRAKEQGMHPDDAQSQAWAQAGQNLLQGSVYTGTRELVNAVEEGLKEAGDGGRKVYPGVNEGERLDRSQTATWLQRKLVSTTVPRITTEAQRKGWLQEKDPTFRSPRDLGEEYKNALGFGLQKSVPAQVDIFGNEAQRGENMGPLQEVFGLGTPAEGDAAFKLMDELGWYPNPPAKTVDGVRISQDKRMAILKAVGPDIHQAVLDLANDPTFRTLPRSEQLDELKAAVSEYMSEANADVKEILEEQIYDMSPEQKAAMKYNLRDKSTSVLEQWGLDD